MTIAKAIVAALTAGLGSLATASSIGHLTLTAYLAAAVVGLVALSSTYAVPNRTPVAPAAGPASPTEGLGAPISDAP